MVGPPLVHGLRYTLARSAPAPGAEGGTMKARRLLMPAILALLVAPDRAGAEGLAGRFSIAVQVGTQSEIAGDLTAATQGTLLGRPATVLAKSYRDVYRPACGCRA